MREGKKGWLVFLLLLLLLLSSFGITGYAVAANFGTRTLLYGSVGNDVAVLQSFLNEVNYWVDAVDGIFGIKTKTGVIGFQKDNSLEPDGIVGPKTFAAIAKVQGNDKTNLYPVQPGDSLYWIALRYGTSITALQQANGLAGTAIQPGEHLKIPGIPTVTPWSRQTRYIQDQPLESVLQAKGFGSTVPNLMIVADKSDNTLSLFSGPTWLKSYYFAIGDGGPADKKVSGDHKTPEGRFYVSERLVLDPPDQYLGTRWLRLSYPSVEDAERGGQQGLITPETYDEIVWANNSMAIPPRWTALGGGIGIHGGGTPELGENWTWGCLGLANQDVEEFYGYVPVGTPVVITP